MQDIQLRHRIAHWRTGQIYYALAAADFIDVLAFLVHIHRPLAACPADTGHVPHFRIGEIVLIGMGLIYNKGVHAQFLKVDHIIFLVCVKQAVIAELEVLAEYLHLFQGPVLVALCLLFTDGFGHGINLRLHGCKLPFSGQANQFKTGMCHNDSVIVPGGNPPGKTTAVLPLKIPFFRHQNIGIGVQLHVGICPLSHQVVGDGEQRLMYFSQPLQFIGQGDGCVGLASPYLMGHQQVALPIKSMGDYIPLVGPQMDIL